MFSLYTELAVEDHDQIPVLQAHQIQVSQAFLAHHMLQASNQVSGSLLDSLQFCSVSFVLGSPELDKILQKCPHKCCKEQDNHFPQPAGYSLAFAVQYSTQAASVSAIMRY